MKVFVDADTLLYSAAAVNEERSIVVTHEPTSVERRFKTRTEFKKYMQGKDKQITPDYIIKDVQTASPVENALHSVKVSAEGIISRFDFCDVTFVAGDSNNFRRDLPLPKRYKSNRESTLRPLHLKACHAYLKAKYNSISPVGHESDDHTALLAYEALRQGKDSCILAPDKDAKQFVGMKIGNYSTEPDQLLSIQVMHDVELFERSFKSYGIPWIAYQLLVGDPSDVYKPTDLTTVKYGDIACYKDLVTCKTPQEILLKVIKKYKQWYPDKFTYVDWNGVTHEADWKSMLELYFKCAKMKESMNDQLIASEFFDKYEVVL